MATPEKLCINLHALDNSWSSTVLSIFCSCTTDSWKLNFFMEYHRPQVVSEYKWSRFLQ